MRGRMFFSAPTAHCSKSSMEREKGKTSLGLLEAISKLVFQFGIEKVLCLLIANHFWARWIKIWMVSFEFIINVVLSLIFLIEWQHSGQHKIQSHLLYSDKFSQNNCFRTVALSCSGRYLKESKWRVKSRKWTDENIFILHGVCVCVCFAATSYHLAMNSPCT